VGAVSGAAATALVLSLLVDSVWHLQWLGWRREGHLCALGENNWLEVVWHTLVHHWRIAIAFNVFLQALYLTAPLNFRKLGADLVVHPMSTPVEEIPEAERVIV
jgi:hypothetical protein